MQLELPGYEIREKLSEDTAFRIYRGQRLEDLTPVRIKVLNHPNPTSRLLAPLWQEFDILRLLDVPGVEKAYALENNQQWWMLVLDELGDRPVSELKIAGKMEPKDFLSVALQLVDILEEVHARQVIHKNISPGSIFFNPSTQQVRLTNFGYASVVSLERVPLQSPYKLADFLAYTSPESTGRMSRSVDYRTDYYSLGASLYELLTGSPPFTQSSPLELVHAHLAILPDSPEDRMIPWIASPNSFRILSAILLKLLEKNPEDRYQTPAALKSDLRQCLSALQEPVQAEAERAVFIPGRLDRPGELNIPQIVLGRELETKVLLDAFYRTVSGPRELLLVTGEAGVGKTTLVNQLVRPVSIHNGFFLYAKYDQTRHLQVYPLLTELLEETCRLVISEPTPSFKEWQERLQAAVAPHGALLTDLCPQLESIIGPQPAVDPVDEEPTMHRFHQVVLRFLGAICKPEHPLVIFLDELQMITKDSLSLWKSILCESPLKNLLVVGAFPENETPSGDPIYSLVHDVETAQGKVTWLPLKNLEPPIIQGLIATALGTDPAEISELSSLVYQKAQGNPYFSIEFLKSLYKDKLLVFHPDEGNWHWDADKIDEYGIAANIVDFYTHEIVNLDETTQKVLQYAALMGRRFDAANLLVILGEGQAKPLASSLWQAIREGLVYPLDVNYRSLLGEGKDNVATRSGILAPSLVDLLEGSILFEFTDTHVQQAALAQLDQYQIKCISIEIGWRLLEKAERSGQESLQKNLLSIVDHLNEGSALIQEPGEAIKVARLNLMAGQKVRSFAAFKAAIMYVSTGIQFLSKNSWQEHYDLTMDLYLLGAEISKMHGDLPYAEELALKAEANVHSLIEKVRVISILMDIYMVQNQLDQVIELGIAAIRLLDFDLDVEEVSVSAISEMIRQSAWMTDPRALAISSLIEPLTSSAYASNPKLFNKFIHFYLNLFSHYGNPPSAAQIYMAYAVNLLGKFHDVDQACQIGKMALEIAERQGPSRTLYTVRFIYHSFINHWLVNARESIPLLWENAQLAFQFENLEFSKNSFDLSFQNSLFVGYPLDQLKSNYAKAFDQLGQSKLKSFRLSVWSQVLSKLVDESPHAIGMHHVLFDDDHEINGQAGQNKIQWFNLYTAQAFLSLFFREHDLALRKSSSAEAVRVAPLTHLITAQHLFIFSLALLSPKLPAGDRIDRLGQVEKNLRLMRLWASLVPENYLHQVELVEAELARSLGRKKEAANKYDRAIHDAAQNEHIHECGLAAELAAEFYLSERDTQAAKEYLQQAYSSYLAWGAKAKLQDLINRYTNWLPMGKENEKQSTALMLKERSTDELAESIDLNTILNASMELAQETSLEELLRKMMAILIKNAGAQTGSLILHQNDRWFLKVQGSADPEKGFALLSTPLEYLSPQVSKSYLPISVIHYVINLKEDLVLEDASASRQFNRDAYIQTRQPKSILCAPLLNQGSLIGVVYLENNLTAGVFTSSRLELVRLISAQAAVSIEKASLYETMEMQVQERTRELSDANRRLKEEINQRIRIEEALRLSEVRYRTVFESTGTAMAVIDEDGYLTLFNEKFVQLTGYSREELEQRFNSLNMIAPADLSRINQFRQEAVIDPLFIVPYSFEFKILDKSGVEKDVIATTTFLPDSKSIIVSLIDITERRSAEEALRYNEALLRKVLDILPVGVWILDKYSRVIRGNPEAFRIWAGIEYVEWRQYDKYKAWRLDTGELLTNETWAATRSINSGEVTLDEELEIEAFDGTHRFILNSAIPLATDQDGPIGAIAVNQDITERKQSEKELQDAHDQLSALLDISQSIVSILDLDHLLNLIIEQLGRVLPYEAAAVMIVEQDQLKFRVIRGPAILQSLIGFSIPISELTLIESLLKKKEAIYLSDLSGNQDLIDQIQQHLKLPSKQFDYLRSWLVLPLVAKGDLIGCLVLTHSLPDYYSAQARTISQVYANHVAIAIHNAQLYRQAGDSAALEERNRLARELHDSVAQALYSISLFIDATRMALRTNRPQVVESHLQELTQLSKEAMSDMRLMIFELRPPILEKVGLVSALQSRLDSVESRAGFQASFHSEGALHLSPEKESELYRIAQEALNNVIKHAQANRVSVRVIGEDDCARLIVEDDGIGFDTSIAGQAGGQGFRNIHERAARIGASCIFESNPGQGTKITITIKQ